MKRTILCFALRADAWTSLDDLRPRIERALGCAFAVTIMAGDSTLTAHVFGMKILLSEWRGLNRQKTFALQSLTDDTRFLDEDARGDERAPNEIDISPAIIDLLAVHGAGNWRKPSVAEIDAEIEYAQDVDRIAREAEDE